MQALTTSPMLRRCQVKTLQIVIGQDSMGREVGTFMCSNYDRE